MKKFIGSSVVAVLAALGLQPTATLAEPPKAAIGEWGVDTTGLSKTVQPGDDFYRYVNEGWLRSAKIPQGLPATDALTELYLSTEQRVLGIIKEHARSDQRIFVGVIDPLDPRVETVDEVKERVLEAADHIPLAQLGTTDDCGFAPFGDDASTARETAFEKIRARVVGTELAARELGA